MTPTPTFTGQDIGLAHYATRALLEASLAESGTSFVDWLVINIVATDGPAVTRDHIVARITDGLKVDASAASEALDGVLATGLVTASTDDASRVDLTPAGEDLVRRVRAAIDRITEVVYGGRPADDLATAHRVLVTVRERANAALAGAS